MAQRYNLVIVHWRKFQDVADFVVIRNMMFGRAPDIDVHIISHGSPVPDGFWQELAAKPTLIFSPTGVPIEPSAPGTRMVGKRLGKLKEVEAFASAGLPVPATAKLTPKLMLDQALWGPFVVLKPNKSGQGRGIRLVRTRDARWVDPDSWPADDPRHGQQMIVQQYVNPGAHPHSYRVFSVLGKPVYSVLSKAVSPVILPDPNGDEPVDIDVTSNGVERTIHMSNDDEILALARRLHESFPTIPTMGIDIVRQHGTGQPFIMEMNSSGFTWHLSSNYGLVQQRRHKLDYYSQFNALSTIAGALIDTTRKYAT